MKVKIIIKDDCCIFCGRHSGHCVEGRWVIPGVMKTKQGDFIIEHTDKCYVLVCSICAEQKIKDLINKGGVK